MLAVLPLALYPILRGAYSWRPQVLPHTSGVYAAAFSPNGNRLTSAQTDGKLLVWDVQHKRVIRTQVLPKYYKSADSWLVFSPDASVVGSCTDDGSVRLWDARTGQFLHRLVHTPSEAYTPGIAFSPDGRTMATTSWRTPVKLWDVATGKQKMTFAQAQISASGLAFSPDGKILASVKSDKKIKLWSLATGKLMRTLAANSAINSLTFSPDGSLLAGGSEAGAKPGEVTLWNTQTGKLQRTLRGHTDFGPMIMPMFSPDGQMLASAPAGLDKSSVKIWDVATGKLNRTLSDGNRSVFPLRFSADSSALATAGNDEAIKVWRVK